jgi:hypothetical protein
MQVVREVEDPFGLLGYLLASTLKTEPYDLRGSMANTSHGHPIPGTDEEPFDGSVHRCGGPGLCLTCSEEVALVVRAMTSKLERSEDSLLVRAIRAITRAGFGDYDALKIMRALADSGIYLREKSG